MSMQVQHLLILSILLNPFTQPAITIEAKNETVHKRCMSVLMWICGMHPGTNNILSQPTFFLYLTSRPRVLLVNTPKQEPKYQSTFPSTTQSLTPLTQHANFSRKYAWLFQFYLMLQCINKQYVSAYIFFKEKKGLFECCITFEGEEFLLFQYRCKIPYNFFFIKKIRRMHRKK